MLNSNIEFWIVLIFSRIESKDKKIHETTIELINCAKQTATLKTVSLNCRTFDGKRAKILSHEKNKPTPIVWFPLLSTILREHAP